MFSDLLIIGGFLCFLYYLSSSVLRYVSQHLTQYSSAKWSRIITLDLSGSPIILFLNIFQLIHKDIPLNKSRIITFDLLTFLLIYLYPQFTFFAMISHQIIYINILVWMINFEVDFQAFPSIMLFLSSESGLRVDTQFFRMKLAWKLCPGAHVSPSASATTWL